MLLNSSLTLKVGIGQVQETDYNTLFIQKLRHTSLLFKAETDHIAFAD